MCAILLLWRDFVFAEEINQFAPNSFEVFGTFSWRAGGGKLRLSRRNSRRCTDLHFAPVSDEDCTAAGAASTVPWASRWAVNESADTTEVNRL